MEDSEGGGGGSNWNVKPRKLPLLMSASGTIILSHNHNNTNHHNKSQDDQTPQTDPRKPQPSTNNGAEATRPLSPRGVSADPRHPQSQPPSPRKVDGTDEKNPTAPRGGSTIYPARARDAHSTSDEPHTSPEQGKRGERKSLFRRRSHLSEGIEGASETTPTTPASPTATSSQRSSKDGSPVSPRSRELRKSFNLKQAFSTRRPDNPTSPEGKSASPTLASPHPTPLKVLTKRKVIL